MKRSGLLKHTRFFVFVTTLLLCLQSAAQPGKGPRSCAEIRWALVHPFAALRVKKIYGNGFVYYRQVQSSRILDAFESGGKTDAFRHIYFMALFSQKIGARKVRKLGIAHEKGNYKSFLKNKNEFGERPDSLAMVMDLANNLTGIALGSENRQLPPAELKDRVIEMIANGKALYFKRNTEGNYVDCGGSVIDVHRYAGKWYVPKCLVNGE